MVGWWTGFPYWLSVAVIAIGGILGVMYSVPLRRALVTGSDLPYPEGVAAAEVLKVGAGVGGAEENRRGLKAMIFGSLVGAAIPLLGKMRLVAEQATTHVPSRRRARRRSPPACRWPMSASAILSASPLAWPCSPGSSSA